MPADVARYDREVADAIAVYPTVPADWVKAVIGAESSFLDQDGDTWEPKVGGYAYGPMQVLLSTARGLGGALRNVTPEELRTPAIGILAGTGHLAQLIARYGYDFRRVYSAYNSGDPDRWSTSATVSGNVDRALGWLDQVGAGDALFWLMALLGVLVIVPAVKRRL